MKLREKLDSEKLFFTSDTHFHHTNILEFCKRPWSNIKTHDLALIQNWNKVVPEDGIVIHAGDLCMTASTDYIRELVKQLNGTIHLVMGNHDYRNRMDRNIIRNIFENRVYDILEFSVQDYYNFIICHYPLLYWHRGFHHLHGHIHSGLNSTASEVVPEHFMRYDIGVDNNNYTPISLEELVSIFMEKKVRHIESKH